MAKQYDATYTIGADDQTLEGVMSSVGNLEKLRREAEHFFESMNLYDKLAKFSLIGMAIYEPFKKGLEMVAEVARESENEIAFSNLARLTGENSDKIVEDMKRAAGGMLTFDRAIQLSGEAMMKGLKGDDMVHLMEAARASTKLTGKDISETFATLSQATVSHSERMLRSVGITIDFESAQRDLASQLRKTKEQLSEAEKSQAFLNAVSEEAERINAGVSESYGSLSEQLKKGYADIGDAYSDLKKAIAGGDGEIFVLGLKAAELAIKGVTASVEGVTSAIKTAIWPFQKVVDVGIALAPVVADGFMKAANEIGRFESEILSSDDKLQTFLEHANALNEIGTDGLAKGVSAAIVALSSTEAVDVMERRLALLKEVNAQLDIGVKNQHNKLLQTSNDSLNAEYEAMKKQELEKQKIIDRFYSSSKTKSEDWVSHQLQQLEVERVRFEAAGIDKDKVNAWVYSQAMAYIKDYQDAQKAVNHDDIENASHKRAAYASMYEALKDDTEKYYDYKKQLLEQQRQEEIDITGNLTLAWEAYYARLQQLEEARTLRSNDFVGGMKVYYEKLTRDGFTWAKASEQMMSDLQSGGENAMQNLLKGIETDTKNIGAHLKNFIKDFSSMFLDAVNKMIAQWIMLQVITGIGKAFAGGGTEGAWAGLGGGTGVGSGMVVHDGGHVAGKNRISKYHAGAAVRKEKEDGDLKNDEVRAVLKVGEYVVNDKAVKDIGVDTLHRLNATGDSGSLGANRRPVVSKPAFDYNLHSQPESSIGVSFANPRQQQDVEAANSVFDRLDKLIAKELSAAATPTNPATINVEPDIFVSQQRQIGVGAEVSGRHPDNPQALPAYNIAAEPLSLSRQREDDNPQQHAKKEAPHTVRDFTTIIQQAYSDSVKSLAAWIEQSRRSDNSAMDAQKPTVTPGANPLYPTRLKEPKEPPFGDVVASIARLYYESVAPLKGIHSELERVVLSGETSRPITERAVRQESPHVFYPETKKEPPPGDVVASIIQAYKDTTRAPMETQSPFAARDRDNTLSLILQTLTGRNHNSPVAPVTQPAAGGSFPQAAHTPESPIIINQAIHFNMSAVDAYSMEKMLKSQSPVIQKIVGDGVERNMRYADHLRGKRQ